MPQFYFDIEHGEACCRDDAGINLEELGDIPREAFILLTNIVQERMLVGHHVLTAQVRDESSSVVFVTKLVIEGRRFV